MRIQDQQKQLPGGVLQKKGVLENFEKLTGKHMCHASLLKERLWHRSFPVNIEKLLRAPFLIEKFRWLLLD